MAEAAPRDPSVRLTRRCDFCGQIDDHPHIVLMQADGTVESGHHDCAADRGSVKAAAIVAAAKGKQGEALTRFLTKGGADHLSTAVEEG
jgi:hypothetical protein